MVVGWNVELIIIKLNEKMIYKFYTTSQKAWDGMFKAISAAQNSVYMEMYIFLDNTRTTHDFLGLLEQKARAGLEIVIIADAWGSSALSSAAITRLRTVGVEFHYFSHLFRRTHRKILIIDKKIAFIGGVNIEEKIRNWHDLQIRVSGKIVKRILKSFAYAYEMAGGRKENILTYSRLPLVQKIKSWVTDNFPRTGKFYYLNTYYRRVIAAAQQSIIIVTPYLLPPRRFIALLENACRRGVRVEILIPRDTDVKPLNKINYLNACRLSEYGAKVYRSPFMNHAKIMLIDNEEGVVGSQNLDVLSFNFNIEAGMFFRQRNLVAELARLIEKWKSESEFFVAKSKQRRWIDRVLIMVFKFLYPIF